MFIYIYLFFCLDPPRSDYIFPLPSLLSIQINHPRTKHEEGAKYFDQYKMSGVWVFKNGVVRLVENPANEQSSTARRKVLLYTPTNEVITSYSSLERKLIGLGWERYYNDPDLIQFHKRSLVDLISLPKDFRHFKSMHMYDIVVKNRDVFRVIDV